MNRRQYLLGFGAATGLGSLSVGTGAFTAARLEGRDANIRVSNDSESLVALVANPRVSGVTEVDGQLEIGLTDPGINVNSVYQFGLFDDDWSETNYNPEVAEFPLVTDKPELRDEDGEFGSAFLIENQMSEHISVEMLFEINENEDSSAGDTKFVFQTHHDGDEEDTLVYEQDSPPEMGLIVDELESGEAFGVSFLVDAVNGAVGDSLSGSVSVAAGQVVDPD